MGAYFLKLKDRDATYLLVNKGLELELNHTSLNRIRVNQFYTEKQYKETIPVLLKLDSIKKMGLYTNTMLVKAYYNLEDFENAKLRFQKVVKIDTEAYKNFTYLGHIAMKQKKYSSAMFNYYRATATGKVKRDAEYYGLENAYYEMKILKMVLKLYKKAFE